MTTKVPSIETHKYGVLVVGDESTSQVIHYAEKPHTYINDLVNTGVYVFESTLISKLNKFKDNNNNNYTNNNNNSNNSNLIIENKISLELDIIQPLVEKSQIFAYILTDKDFWYQIKTASNALHASHVYMKQKLSKSQYTQKCLIIGEVEIHPTADVHPTAKIGPNVTIGENVKIGKGVRISHSIILDNSNIKDSSFISFSIIGWRTTIGKWSRIEGHSSTNTYNNENSSEKDSKITVLGHDVVVLNEILVADSVVLPNKEISVNIQNRIIL